MNKKIIIFLLGILLLVGCENNINTPTSKVESFLNKYQMLDKNVLLDLDNTLNKDKNLTKKQKEKYKELLKKQYQNLSYKIMNEEIENKIAIVEVKIEVLDYSSIKEKNIDERLNKMKNIESKKDYELTFYLTKEKGIWKIDNLTEDDYKKINGLY